MMKRIQVLLCLILLLGVILCACGTSTVPETPATDEPVTDSPKPAEPGPAASPDDVLASLYPDAKTLGVSTVCKQITLPDTDPDAVRDTFLAAGYVETPVTSANGTKLRTDVLRSIDDTVTLIGTSDGSVHVLCEKAADISIDPLCADPDATGGDVTAVQIGIERGDKDDNPMIGMCYLYRLGDGSAVILDGGVKNKGCAENLYKALAKMDIAKNEAGQYRIAAWIFSHGHADHIGTFRKFITMYAEQTDLAYLMYSFPAEETGLSYGLADHAFEDEWKSAYPNAKQINPHAGLRYFFGNLSIDVLYAPELRYTSRNGITWFNNTSLILHFVANGKGVLHMGDAGESASIAAWNENTPEAFRSQFFQITHHGLYTGNDSHVWDNMKKIYQATEASAGLLPMGTQDANVEKNGRFEVLVKWARDYRQVSFVTDPDDKQGLIKVSQEDYEAFVDAVAAGTNEYETLCGYNGINLLTNKDGMTTYISATETEPMATVFTLSDAAASVLSNQTLSEWLAD